MGKSRMALTGVGEAIKNIQMLSQMYDGAQMYDVLADAIEPMKERAKANVAPLSMSVSTAIKVRPPASLSGHSRKSVALLLDKKQVMRQWIAARMNRSPNARVAPGGRVSESLGAMLEGGTSRGMMAHFWFRSAFDSTKGAVRQRLKTSLEQIVTETTARFVRPAR